ncbi:ABC transporter ATP-binding protein [Brucella pseudogrignonensis]|uniref:ABC transporter ATP-binding protein n=1 Tax=Brucella pseudogrignonensis TaxID=419475 RepID=UPI0028B3F223|nr:ABC transporter ATP-binding protein [Brucella pseudogrignonensis]MDT6942422.1 ABC transporter ATP-binding protein [Brucella pseudogrignonensis]
MNCLIHDADNPPVLAVKNLRTSFLINEAWSPVVKDISFDVPQGKTVAIVGESGSGKSVTSLSIMRLLDAAKSKTVGSVKLEGKELLSLGEEDMRQTRGQKLAMIFQEPMTSLNPIFSIGHQISEAMLCHGDMSPSAAKEEAIRLLEKVRIANAVNRYDEFPHQFSGGMRQRVMIAMALAAKPRLLIADEPTTALDVTIQGQILDLMRMLQEENGTSILFITHDMGVVAEIADKTLVMYKGQIVEEGSSSDLFSRPRHPYSKALLSAVPRLGAMTGKPTPAHFPLLHSEAADIVAPYHHTPRPTKVLEVNDLVTRFAVRSGFFNRISGIVHAVQDVSFDIREGETLSLVGESGCGKSTTGRSILRMIEPSAGKVTLDGYDVLDLDKENTRAMRRSAQMIFQDPFASFNPRLRIETAVCEPFLEHALGTKNQAREKAAMLMERVGLSPDMLRRFPHEFSGGQRQRISIARALMVDPKLIVADECVSALDVSIKAQVCNLLLELQQNYNLAFLFISHDMAVVERMSHRVAVMRLGEIMEIGTRQAVFENPQHEYTKTLMSAAPVPDPDRRPRRRDLSTDELKNPIRPPNYSPPKRQYRSAGQDHLVTVN